MAPLFKKRVGYGAVSAVVATILIYLGSQILSAVSLGIYGQMIGLTPEESTRLLEQSVAAQFSFIILVSIFTLGLLYLFARRRQITLGDIGLGRKPRLADLGSGLTTFGLYFLALIAVLATVGVLFPGINLEQQQQLGFDQPETAVALAIVFISLVILPPVVEEILIRGFLYSGLKKSLKPLSAALIASLIFGAAHLEAGSGEPLLWVAAIDTFVLSLFLIRLREKTKSLFAGMFTHFLKNSLAFTSLFILGAV